jgi:hypothetical protein
MNNPLRSTCAVCDLDCTQVYYDHYTGDGKRVVCCSTAHLTQWLREHQEAPVYYYRVDSFTGTQMHQDYSGHDLAQVQRIVGKLCLELAPGASITVYRNGAVYHRIEVK